METQNNRTDKKTAKSVLIVFLFFLVVSVVIVGRLASLQIENHDKYKSQVLNQLTIEQDVSPERGTITDRNGVVLATNITVYNVILSPKDILKQLESDMLVNSDNNEKNDVYYEYSDEEFGIRYSGTRVDELIAEALSKYLDLNKADILATEAKEGRQYELLKKNVSSDIHDRINVLIDEFGLKKDIYYESSYKRFYPKGDLACHAIGFVNSEGVGIYGIEAYYNNVLEGTAGKYIIAQDAKQNEMPFEYERIITEENGSTVRLTLDVTIQYELEDQLKKTFYDSGAGNRVCGIVMDVDTGEILAMATYPSFNLNDPYTLDEWSESQLKAMDLKEGSDEYEEAYLNALYKMWNNKCVTETYEPGSTFKVITSCMAIEEGVISQYDMFYCGGSLAVDGWSAPISCALETGHGMVTFRYGLQQSCNPTLMQVAAKIGREKFYYYFDAFGYTEKTGVDLPGEAMTIYAPYSNFSAVSLAVYSFGQTFRVTPIQQIRAISAVANGGVLLTPHLLKDIQDTDGNIIESYKTNEVRQVVSAETCELLTDILEEGVATDGAAKNAYVTGYRVAAKTGTSEKLDEYDEFGNRPYRVGSTVAFAPADDPQISALIMVDKPLNGVVYGGSVAAPYISNLLSYVLPFIGVEAQYTAEELSDIDVTLSNYIGATVDACMTDLSWRGFKYEIVGDGNIVTQQVPSAGSQISNSNGILILYTGEEQPASDVQVPNFLNMSAFNANNTALSMGLNISFTGSLNGSTASVISQSIEPGTYVPRGTVIEIELRHLDNID